MKQVTNMSRIGLILFTGLPQMLEEKIGSALKTATKRCLNMATCPPAASTVTPPATQWTVGTPAVQFMPDVSPATSTLSTSPGQVVSILNRANG